MCIILLNLCRKLVAEHEFFSVDGVSAVRLPEWVALHLLIFLQWVPCRLFFPLCQEVFLTVNSTKGFSLQWHGDVAILQFCCRMLNSKFPIFGLRGMDCWEEQRRDKWVWIWDCSHIRPRKSREIENTFLSCSSYTEITVTPALY